MRDKRIFTSKRNGFYWAVKWQDERNQIKHKYNKKNTLVTIKKVVTRRRHIAKTITWRLVGSLDTMMLGWLVSGDPMIGLKVGVLEVFTKMILYYFHERMWYKTAFGIKQ